MRSTPSSYTSEIITITFRYSDRFTTAEIDEAKKGITLPSAVDKVAVIIDGIGDQMVIGLALILSLGILFSVGQSRKLPDEYNGVDEKQVARSERFQHWLNTGTSLSTSISGAISVAVALVGAVSLVSPKILGGYIIVALQALVICIFLGILRHAMGTEIVTKVDNTNSKVTLDPKRGAQWEGITSTQFLMLVVGIVLLILQVLFYF
ncbi:MAG: hypothetical protein ACREBU_02525 [Nitrososphaera sp.]